MTDDCRWYLTGGIATKRWPKSPYKPFVSFQFAVYNFANTVYIATERRSSYTVMKLSIPYYTVSYAWNVCVSALYNAVCLPNRLQRTKQPRAAACFAAEYVRYPI